MITYKDAGVDVDRGYAAVRRMKAHAQSTFDKNVLAGLGSFGGCYAITDYANCGRPVLVSGADGVGTKLRIAFLMDKHDTVGIDCVAMCVDDVVCQGARPLFFLDYLATGRINPAVAGDIVGGVADGCRQAGCVLIGGETAEMPGFYATGEYDLAGFCVGIVDESEVITGRDIQAGDALIGLASSGVHSNGFALIRKLLLNDEQAIHKHSAELGKTIGEELLTPTRIYAKNLLALMQKTKLKGVAHITGGGFIENIPRMFPSGLGCTIRRGGWEIPPVFDMLRQAGGLDDAVLYNTFNMGIGMVLAVAPQDTDACLLAARELDEAAYVIGEVRTEEGVTLS